MKNKLVGLVKTFCEENEYSFSNGYSGRGMYGGKCISITTGDILLTLLELSDYLHNNGIESATDTLGSPCMDSMGMDKVVYFPDCEA